MSESLNPNWLAEDLARADDDFAAMMKALDPHRVGPLYTAAELASAEAAAHAKGRAEGIGEAVKIAAILDVGLSEIDDLFSDIRNDWSDPRSECRQGRAAVESMRGLLRALLPTTGGTDA